MLGRGSSAKLSMRLHFPRATAGRRLSCRTGLLLLDRPYPVADDAANVCQLGLAARYTYRRGLLLVRRGGNEAGRRMKRFVITDDFSAECVVGPDSFAGQLFHVHRNPQGGANLTPVARFFGWRPSYIEGGPRTLAYRCFFKSSDLAKQPLALGEVLVDAVVREAICSEPIWLSVHRSEELRGKAYGQLFELE